MLYISERIANISELERQIQNAKLHFDILKEELKHTAPSISPNASNFLSSVLISQFSNSKKQFDLSLSLSIPDTMFCSLSLITRYIFRTNLHLLTKVYFLAITFEL